MSGPGYQGPADYDGILCPSCKSTNLKRGPGERWQSLGDPGDVQRLWSEFHQALGPPEQERLVHHRPLRGHGKGDVLW